MVHLHKEIGRLHIWERHLEILDDVDVTSLMDTDSFDFRGIGHEIAELVDSRDWLYIAGNSHQTSGNGHQIQLRRTVITHHTGRAGNAIRQRSGRPPPTFVTTSTTRRTLPQAGCSTRCEVGFLTRRFGLGASTDDVASGPPLTPRLVCFALKLRVNSSFVTSKPSLARRRGFRT